MLFNSFNFGLFLVVVYSLYWLIGTKNRKLQNVLILLASYFFYGLWDWRFLLLLLASTLIDFFGAQAIARSRSRTWKRFYLWHNVFWNIGVLVLFKYYHFFLDSFYELFSMGSRDGYHLLNVVIPVGLSFYTFQTLGYTIDVYRGKIRPTNNFLNFMCFVSFFPQLVAGPIERAGKLLPQIEQKRSFDLSQQKDGLRLILWGLFKKMVIADNLGHGVSLIYADHTSYGTFMLVAATVLFAIQIYYDFSGYTDIAMGSAKLIGINLSLNFKLPYVAHSITEFWGRWHITLTNWFTDYVYMPILRSGKRLNLRRIGMAIMITMVLIGLWHGANWTFVLLGVFDGLILILERAPIIKGKTLSKFLSKAPRPITFCYFWGIITIHNVFFRSENISQAFEIFRRIFTLEGDRLFQFGISSTIYLMLIFVIIAELSTPNKVHPMEGLENRVPLPLRWILYYGMIFCIFWLSRTKDPFIYFQF